MTTSPPESRSAPDWMVCGRAPSVEVRALMARLSQRSGVQASFGERPIERPQGTALVILCDLAHPGDAAWALQGSGGAWGSASRCLVVALGSAREETDETRAVLERAALRLKRPLDLLKTTRLIEQQTAESSGPEAASLPPTAASTPPELSHPPNGGEPLEPRPQSVQPSSGVPPASRQAGGGGLDESEASPELAQLLADAAQRVAQLHLEPASSAHNLAPKAVERESPVLSSDVWKALEEPLEDDVEPMVDEFRDDEASPNSPVIIHPATSDRPPPPDAEPPSSHQDWGSEVDEDTGSHAPKEVSEAPSSLPAEQTASLIGGESDAPPSRPTVRPGGTVRLSSEFITGPPTAPPTASPNEQAEARVVVTPDFAREGSVPPTLNPEGQPSSPPTVGPMPSIHTAAPPSVSEERGTISPDPLDSITAARRANNLQLPDALVLGASARAIGRAVRARFTGCMTFEEDRGLRRVVFREGAIVIGASAVHGESLVAFLTERGDIGADLSKQIEHRVPPFGRHAGAALIARGVLQQGDLWPVLRSHSEWVLTQVLRIERGSVRIEHPIPERLAAEPSVFGGATGAEVLVETLQRAVPPEHALQLLGGGSDKFTMGSSSSLLAECALSSDLKEWVEQATEQPLQPLLAQANNPMLPAVLLALCLLDVLEPHQSPSVPTPEADEPDRPESRDDLDDEAVRTRVKTRRDLVEDGDYFALLGVQRHATGYEIRRSYLELKKQLDPARILRPATLDLRDDVDTILEVLDEAYDILKDQRRRERYRRAIEAAPIW